MKSTEQAKPLQAQKPKIDIRSPHCLYVEMDDWIFYIDNSTNEQIMDCWRVEK